MAALSDCDSDTTPNAVDPKIFTLGEHPPRHDFTAQIAPKPMGYQFASVAHSNRAHVEQFIRILLCVNTSFN